MPIETLEELRGIIDGLSNRAEPLVERLGPAGGRRGGKYAHRLCPPAELSASRAKEGASEPTALRV